MFSGFNDQIGLQARYIHKQSHSRSSTDPCAVYLDESTCQANACEWDPKDSVCWMSSHSTSTDFYPTDTSYPTVCDPRTLTATLSLLPESVQANCLPLLDTTKDASLDEECTCLSDIPDEVAESALHCKLKDSSSGTIFVTWHVCKYQSKCETLPTAEGVGLCKFCLVNPSDPKCLLNGQPTQLLCDVLKPFVDPTSADAFYTLCLSCVQDPTKAECGDTGR